MPLQELPRWSFSGIIGKRDQRATVEGVVLSAVVELLTDPGADLDSMVGRDGHIARVEEGVEV